MYNSGLFKQILLGGIGLEHGVEVEVVLNALTVNLEHKQRETMYKPCTNRNTVLGRKQLCN